MLVPKKVITSGHSAMKRRLQRAEENTDAISPKRIRQASASSSSVSQSARPVLHRTINIAVPMTTTLLVPVHLASSHRVNNKLVAPSLHDHQRRILTVGDGDFSFRL